MKFLSTGTVTNNCGAHQCDTQEAYVSGTWGFTLFALDPKDEEAFIKYKSAYANDAVHEDRIQLTDDLVLYVKTKIRY